MKPEIKKVYSIRLDDSDIRAIKKLGIKVSPIIRRFVKKLIRTRMQTREELTWKLRNK